jgi:methyl-accepting chemotaxis protein
MSNHQVRVFSSIQFKVIIVSVTTISVILGCFAAIDLSRKHTRAREDLIQSTNIVARRLAENEKIPLWDLNQESAKDILLAEMQVPDVYALAVFANTKNGENLFTGAQRDAGWGIIDYNGAQPDGLVKQTMQVETKNDKLGHVEVYLSPRIKNQELIRNVISMIIALMALDLGIIAVLWLMLRSFLIRPITHLSSVAEEISLGKFGQELQFNSRSDEIGLLARAIGRMETSLDMAINRLNTARTAKRG